MSNQQQNEQRPVQVLLIDGSKVLCASQEDARLVLDADRRLYEGEPGRKLPRRTLLALERAGLRFSSLYRSAESNLENDS